MQEFFDAIYRLDYGFLVWALDLTNSSEWLTQLVFFCAEVLIYVFPLVLLYLWQRPEAKGLHHGSQKAVVIAVFSLVFSLALKSVINYAYLRDRPFVTHPDLLYMPFHVDPISFPSGHTVIAFAIAFSIYLSGYVKLSWVLLACALLVGVSRVFAGVHYPSDILGGILLAWVVAWSLHRESSSLKRYLPNH